MRELGEPLVPAGREAEAGCHRVHHRVRRPRPAGPADLNVLVVARGHGDVQLARARRQRAVGREHHCGVEAQAVLAVGALRRVTRARADQSPRANSAANAWSARPPAARARRRRPRAHRASTAKYGDSVSSCRHTSWRPRRRPRGRPRRARRGARRGRDASGAGRAPRAARPRRLLTRASDGGGSPSAVISLRSLTQGSLGGRRTSVQPHGFRASSRPTMTRCIHTGVSIPECSCRACLRELVRVHAPRPAASAPPPPAPAPAADARRDRPQAA